MPRLPVFECFIADLRSIWAAEADLEARMMKAQKALEHVLEDPSLVAHSKTWPSTEPSKESRQSNLLLYEDPDYGFVINGVVRTPGRKGGVHDHAHAWVVYGILDGVESLERYDRLDDGSRAGYAELRLASVTESRRGQADLVPPFAIHSERGGEARSVGLIVRSERVAGRVLQRSFDPATNVVIERTGPVQIPFEVLAPSPVANV
jgi:predicted metal-dependent enzyme (double-stranded beta helix superfamily)